MSEFKFFSDIYSADFTIYEPGYTKLVEIGPQLEQYQLFPKYFSAPLFLMWEMTGKCPCNCIYCYNGSPKVVKELTPEEAMNLAKDIVKMKPFSVCLTGGEPTLREDLFEIASYLKKNGIPVSTITSGWTMNEKLAEKMCSVFDYLQVSIDGPRAEIHDGIRGVRGSFERAVNAVKLLKEKGVKRLSVAYSLTKYNKENLPDMIRLCQSLGVDELRTQYLVMVGQAGKNKEIELSQEEYNGIISYIEEKQRELENEGSSLSLHWGNPIVHIAVGAVLKRVVILRITAEGNYAISPYLPFIMGNAREHSISEIWNSGMRRGWEIPEIYENIKDVVTVSDVYTVNQKLGSQCIDILKNRKVGG